MVLRLPPRTRRSLMYNKLNWLTVNQLIAYHTLIAVYRVRQSREPEYLAVSMKSTELGVYRNSFVFRGSVLWNKLRSTLKNQKKVSLA